MFNSCYNLKQEKEVDFHNKCMVCTWLQSSCTTPVLTLLENNDYSKNTYISVHRMCSPVVLQKICNSKIQNFEFTFYWPLCLNLLGFCKWLNDFHSIKHLLKPFLISVFISIFVSPLFPLYLPLSLPLSFHFSCIYPHCFQTCESVWTPFIPQL